MAEPTVSIIMPVYGVEKYLPQSVQSVLAQTCPDFELILVDDCSPDGSGRLCDEFAAKDARVRVIHKPVNEGLGFARNTGYDAARGRYLYFLDSDDWIAPELLEKALAAMDEQTDIVAFGVRRVYETAEGAVDWTEELRPQAMHGMPGEAFLALSQAKIFNFAWNKLYRKRFLDTCGTRFEQTRLIEDFLFNIDVFAKASSVAVIEEPLYHYRKPAHETLVSAYAPEFFALSKRKYCLEKEFLIRTGVDTEENRQFIMTGYIKHLVSVFLKNRSPKAALSPKQQKALMREALADPLTREVLDAYQPCGMQYKLLCALFRKKRTGLCYRLVAAADFLQNKKRFKKVLSK